MEFVTILNFENVAQAHIYKSKLESEGIHVFLKDENMMGVYPVYNLSVGGVKLQVRAEDVEAARQILAVDENAVLKSKVKCPICGSSEVWSSYHSVKDAKGFIAIVVALLFEVLPFYSRLVYKCKDCGNEFKHAEEK